MMIRRVHVTEREAGLLVSEKRGAWARTAEHRFRLPGSCSSFVTHPVDPHQHSRVCSDTIAGFFNSDRDSRIMRQPWRT